jgi:Na+/glutamate symporter
MNSADIKAISEKTKVSLSTAAVGSIICLLVGGGIGSLSLARAYGAESAKTEARIHALEKESSWQRQELEAIKSGVNQMNLTLTRIDERLAKRP